MKIVWLLLTMLLPVQSFASELLPEGTEFKLPGDDYILLNDVHFLLTRDEINTLIVQGDDLDRLRASLATCQETLKGNPNPKPGFWSTTTGKGIVIGGFTVTVTGAFIGGFYLAAKTK